MPLFNKVVRDRFAFAVFYIRFLSAKSFLHRVSVLVHVPEVADYAFYVISYVECITMCHSTVTHVDVPFPTPDGRIVIHEVGITIASAWWNGTGSYYLRLCWLSPSL